MCGVSIELRDMIAYYIILTACYLLLSEVLILHTTKSRFRTVPSPGFARYLLLTTYYFGKYRLRYLLLTADCLLRAEFRVSLLATYCLPLNAYGLLLSEVQVSLLTTCY